MNKIIWGTVRKVFSVLMLCIIMIFCEMRLTQPEGFFSSSFASNIALIVAVALIILDLIILRVLKRPLNTVMNTSNYVDETSDERERMIRALATTLSRKVLYFSIVASLVILVIMHGLLLVFDLHMNGMMVALVFMCACLMISDIVYGAKWCKEYKR